MDKFTLRTKILQTLKENMIKFINELIVLLPNEPDMMVLRIMFAEQIAMEDAVALINERVWKYREMVYKKDDAFFLAKEDIFSGLQGDKVSYFKRLWQSDIDDDNREAIWLWFLKFIHIVEKYNATFD